MEIKYEAVFGDQAKLNDQTNELAEVMLWHDFLGPKFVSLKELGEMNASGAIPSGSVILAMRRIIAEPKRWTVEDQKAGRLPETGSLVKPIAAPISEFVGVDARDHGLWCFRYFSAERSYVFSCLKGRCSPIETPEEKAQREEDEFVSLVESKYNKMPNEISFKAGIRAAYRKLKGGE